MNAASAAIVGLLIGTVPTATIIARRLGVDLLGGGSGNPGANNALRLGGRRLGAVVLGAEITKGVGAVVVGGLVAGPWGSAAAGIAACVGNVLNPWLRFRGGQGLGIAAGVLLAGWPLGFAAVLLIVASVARLSRSAHVGALSGVAGLVIGSSIQVPQAWGLADAPLRLLVLGVATVIVPKQIARLRARSSV